MVVCGSALKSRNLKVIHVEQLKKRKNQQARGSMARRGEYPVFFGKFSSPGSTDLYDDTGFKDEGSWRQPGEQVNAKFKAIPL